MKWIEALKADPQVYADFILFLREARKRGTAEMRGAKDWEGHRLAAAKLDVIDDIEAIVTAEEKENAAYAEFMGRQATEAAGRRRG